MLSLFQRMRFSIKHLIILIPIFTLLFIRVINSGIYASDSEIYFYTSYKMLQGQMLYKDIFFTNLPLFPVISSLYFLLSGGNFLIYEFTSSFEAIFVSCLIYYLSYKRSKNVSVSLLTASLFIFSPIILKTSLNQTGVYTAMLLFMIGFLFLDKKRFTYSGIAFAMSVLTKAYFFPIFIAIVISFVLKKEYKSIFRLLISFFLTAIILIAPFIFLSGSDMIKDIVFFSLNRIRSFELNYLFWLFISNEPLLMTFLLLSLIFIKENKLVGIISITFIMFFIFYSGMQFLYMSIVIPFLCLYALDLFYIAKKLNVHQVFITIILIYISYSALMFGFIHGDDGKIQEIDKLIATVKLAKPNYIYGSSGVSQIIAYLTNVPLFRNQIDTDGQLYVTGALNKHEWTKEAISKKALLVAQGYDNPITGKMTTTSLMFDLTLIKTSKCQLTGKYRVNGRVLTNKIYLVKCF